MTQTLSFMPRSWPLSTSEDLIQAEALFVQSWFSFWNWREQVIPSLLEDTPSGSFLWLVELMTTNVLLWNNAVCQAQGSRTGSFWIFQGTTPFFAFPDTRVPSSTITASHVATANFFPFALCFCPHIFFPLLWLLPSHNPGPDKDLVQTRYCRSRFHHNQVYVCHIKANHMPVWAS